MPIEPKAVDVRFATQLYINGRWRDGSGGTRFPVFDPATGEQFTCVASASVDDVLEAVAAAHAAFPAWAAVSPRGRSEILRRAFETMIRRESEIARLIVRENGKAMPDALSEVRYAADFFRWYGEEAVRAIGELSRAPAGGNRIVVLLEPVGVSVLVTPWNFPAAMATRKIGPALAAGCTVVLKPASDTPLTALAIASILEEAGVPPGVCNVVPSSSSGKVVSAMLHDARVRKLSFTGSTEVGRVLLREAADHVVSSSMELGGNAPFIVLDDADLDGAVQGALIAKMRNGGQACTAANRFYVERRIAKVFGERFAAAMRDIQMGSGTDPQVALGPMINAAACRRIQALVDEAGQGGARILIGGTPARQPGYFYPPTVLEKVPRDARILREEIFGPVAPIVEVEDEDEAIEQANNTEFGLAAYLYTGDLKRGLRVSEKLEAGMIGLNRGIVSDPAAPFGGVKQSGLGREGAHEGMMEYLERKYVAVEW